jgi:hypothetical protein
MVFIHMNTSPSPPLINDIRHSEKWTGDIISLSRLYVLNQDRNSDHLMPFPINSIWIIYPWDLPLKDPHEQPYYDQNDKDRSNQT